MGTYRSPVRSAVQIVHDLDRAMRNDPRTQREIMRTAGVTNHAYSLWKRGDYSPTLDRLQAVAKVLGYRVTLIREEPNDA